MHKHEWAYPVVGLLIMCTLLSLATTGVKHQQHNPSVLNYRLRNH